MWVGRRLRADQDIHCRKLACRVEFIAQLTRSRPYEEVGGYPFPERLHKDLVVMALDLEAVWIGYGERGHRLAKLKTCEMVQRGFNMTDLALTGGLRPRRGNRKSKGNRHERFHSCLQGRNICLKNGKEKPSQRPRLLLRRLGVPQGNGSTRVFEQQIALPLVLEEKDSLFAFRAFRIGDSFDEECSPLIVKPRIAIDGLRHSNPNPLAASHLREGIDHLLRKRLEEDRAGTCAASNDSIHRLRPRPPVLLLALRPVVNEQMQGAELIPCILLMFPESCLRPVTRKHRRPSLFFVFTQAHCFPLPLSVLQLLLDLFLALDNSACYVAVDRIDQLAFLEHLPGYVLAREKSTEVFDPHLLFETVAGFVGKKAELLAQEVIEPSNLVRIRDLKMGRQVRHSALSLVAEPGSRRYLLPDFTDNGLINLDPVFEGIECVLQLLDELVGQVRPSRRNARSLQIGDRTDPISSRLHGNRACIPPGRLCFLMLRLFLPELLPVCDPSRNELR